jgi:putative hemolysin
MKANVLFNKMKQQGNYFAVVVDEYGGMTGIISVRDLIEVLVGDLYEEGELDEIEMISEGLFKISGNASVDEVNESLSVKIDTEEYDTFGGYVLALLGEVPEDGAKPILETKEMEIKVEKVLKRRIISCIVTKKVMVEVDQ